VLLGGGDRQRALVRVEWKNHYLGVFLFDEQERRVRAYDYRELSAGLLHLRCYEEWRPASADKPKSRRAVGTSCTTARPGSETAGVRLRHRGSLHTVRDLPEQHRALRRAAFGDWVA
jgi:hypothetical protein